MKFIGEGNTTVWDPQRDRELCRFEKGELETEDPRTCKTLIELGYEYEGEAPLKAWLDGEPVLADSAPVVDGEPVLADSAPVVDGELTALRAKGKELKIKGASQMGLEKLTQAIAEAEKGAEA